MKLAVIAAVATVAGSPMVAMDLGTSGISLGGEAVTEYAMDAERMTLVVTPEATYTFNNILFAASTDIDVYDNEFVVDSAFDILPTVDFRVEAEVISNMTTYVETSYDLDAKARGEVTVGASFAF